VKDTDNLFIIAEQLKNGLLWSGHNKEMVYKTAVVVVFSNALPPFECLSKDRWEIYRINYNNEGASNLQRLSNENYASPNK
jgi:hypothetical protein